MSSRISRRRVIAGLAAVPSVAVLGGCAIGGGGGESTGATGGTAEKTPENPFGVVADSTLEVVGFSGGAVAVSYEKVHNPAIKAAFPQLQLTYTGTESQTQVLQPRFVGGTPPDFVDNTGAGQMDINALISQEQVLDLTPLFDAPSVDDPAVPLKDTLLTGTLEAATYNGVPRVVPYTTGPQGLWYDRKLFAKNGWAAPATWADFLAVLEKAKAAGLQPFGFAGKTAPDYCTTAILSSAIKAGGLDVVRNIDNLAEGAWRADAVKQALTAWAEIGAKYVARSNEGLQHTEVQLLQTQGKLAFYPCGSWLEGEMTKDIPPGFEYAMIATPSLSPADKLPAAALRATPTGAFFVAAKGKNTAAALEYLRRMLSRQSAAGHLGVTSQLTVVRDATDGVELSAGTRSAADALTAAGADTFTWKFMGWYKPMADAIKEATNGLMFGRLTPDAFADTMQKVADEVRADSSITKFQRQ
ncbi:carbohydrate ABC transporter, N-acetylglucosamine/diacetylchitobiose-binding protein [Actinoplanes sp. OR16]|uniref:N-acetylglucosamine/diacetylchitobiose ABC transporter substrate-binding protein n=1 Tax=Actinoplanes sp. OR16 TaxID=946334 RepID=UPI000F7124E4|nr:N-acetylglucosamine/diacetylchitobiose ABC transporter substrate-binding protein [Actinoplanes sp. OR16]BBH68434.1 carbohydrate ABC transporter, N-acetylglucosamine/diacetylchitobiose-binding protein [Actinoplanes sp. OR16]